MTEPGIAAALVAALTDLTVVEPKRTAKAGAYSYRYADISDVVKLTRPILAAHGLAAMTPVHEHGDGLACTVELVHVSGESKSFPPLPFPPGTDAQATGSAITYHRRYALIAALGMAAGDDDDGAAAKARPEPVWNMTKVKARLVDLLGGDKAKAKEAWTLGHGDDLEEFTGATADWLAEQWLANQPADEGAE